MTFARIWRGRTRREDSDEYERYWRANGSRPLLARGARAVQMMREDHDDYSEFVTISYWDSIETMGAGADPTLTHHLPRDREFLLELSERVQILTVLEMHGEL